MKITRNSEGRMVVSFVYDTKNPDFAIANPDRKDVFAAFVKQILESMIRRQKACECNLAHHAGDSVLTYNGNTIAWKREGGTFGYFNIPTWETIKNTIKCLEFKELDCILNNPEMVDQIIKAIMNDTEFNRTDQTYNGIKIPFSMLVSVLVDQFAQLVFKNNQLIR